MASVLIVEDDPLQQEVLAATINDAGHEASCARTGSEALRICARIRPEVVLLDLGLPDTSGLDLLPELVTSSPLSRTVVLTGTNEVPIAVEALRRGARHYLVKPYQRNELLLVVDREARAGVDSEVTLRDASASYLKSQDPRMVEIWSSLERLAGSPFTAVLLQGESGTGKEVVARELHRLSNMEGAFVPVNCSAIAEGVQESEVFGHEPGSFTGASARRRGVLELAREGTLFLDEIGEAPGALQAQLLRFLEDGSFRRVGGERELTSRCRVIAATHCDLETMVREGRFRQDLLFRLAVVRIEIPSLREREESILPLAHHLLRRLSQQLGRPARQLSSHAEIALRCHSWPGNVRELRNRLERALVLGAGVIEAADLDLAAPGTGASQGSREPTEAELRQALEAEDWVVTRAANRLGVARHWLRYRIERFGLRRGA